MARRWVRTATIATALAVYGALAPVAGAADGEVTISGFTYTPGTITVAEGDTVTWTSLDPVSHSPTGAEFDAGALVEGASGAFTFKVAGTFEYGCRFHPNMKGTVVVAATTAGAGSVLGAGSGSAEEAVAPATDSGPGGSDGTTGLNLMAIVVLALAGIAGFATVARRRQRVRVRR